PYRYQAAGTDPDGVSLAYVLARGPNGMSVNAQTGLLSWDPESQSPASAPVLLKVYDSRGGVASQEFTVTVAGGNRAPAFNPLPNTLHGSEGQLLQIAVTATDPDDDALAYG